MSSKDLVRKIHFLFTLSLPCSNSCLVKVQGAGDCRLLERLASAEWCEVPAAGGLPGQPAPRHVSAAGASGHPLHRGPHRRFLLLWLKGIVVEKWNDKLVMKARLSWHTCCDLFQVTFIKPVIERGSNLQRQRRIFPKEKGKNNQQNTILTGLLFFFCYCDKTCNMIDFKLRKCILKVSL